MKDIETQTELENCLRLADADLESPLIRPDFAKSVLSRHRRKQRGRAAMAVVCMIGLGVFGVDFLGKATDGNPQATAEFKPEVKTDHQSGGSTATRVEIVNSVTPETSEKSSIGVEEFVIPRELADNEKNAALARLAELDRQEVELREKIQTRSRELRIAQLGAEFKLYETNPYRYLEESFAIASHLVEAELFERQGRLEEARQSYQNVIKNFPNGHGIEAVKSRL